MIPYGKQWAALLHINWCPCWANVVVECAVFNDRGSGIVHVFELDCDANSVFNCFVLEELDERLLQVHFQRQIGATVHRTSVQSKHETISVWFKPQLLDCGSFRIVGAALQAKIVRKIIPCDHMRISIWNISPIKVESEHPVGLRLLVNVLRVGENRKFIIRKFNWAGMLVDLLLRDVAVVDAVVILNLHDTIVDTDEARAITEEHVLLDRVADDVNVTIMTKNYEEEK